MNKNLPPYEKVFFTHYQCNDFNEGKNITTLSIYSEGETIEFKSESEIKNIEDYSNLVNSLLEKGLTLIHWGQNKSYFGTTHINERFKELSDKDLNLKYINNINLAEWLVFEYGENYISHPRLDNLAKLNNFYGIRENELGQRTYTSNRLMLLTKIYINVLKNTLKTENKTESTNIKNIVKNKKTPEKWYALLYWFELAINNKKPPTNHDGAFIRKEIEEKRKKETGKDGQIFYREFKEINIDDEKELNNKFGKDWKNKIIELSNNNEKIKQYLISKYNS